MAARMLLSLFLDFFKCGKSIMAQPVLNASKDQLPEAPAPAPAPALPAKPSETEREKALERTIAIGSMPQLDDELGYDDPRLPELII